MSLEGYLSVDTSHALENQYRRFLEYWLKKVDSMYRMILHILSRAKSERIKTTIFTSRHVSKRVEILQVKCNLRLFHSADLARLLILPPVSRASPCFLGRMALADCV
jgi:hypothetical protein